MRIHGAAGRARHGCRSGRDARMAEQLLDRAQIRAALEQVGREGMAQGVRGDPARPPRPRTHLSRRRRRRRARRAVFRGARRTARAPRGARACDAPSRGSVASRAEPVHRSERGASSPLPVTRTASESKSTSPRSTDTISSARSPHEYASSNIARSRTRSGPRGNPVEQRRHLVAQHSREVGAALRRRQQVGGIVRGRAGGHQVG